MEPWHLAVLLKPIGLLFMLAPGAVLVWYLRKHLPESKLKRFMLISWKV